MLACMYCSARQSGFTLIEVISVVVLLGILGSFAMGRYQDLSDGAESATVDSIYASVSNYLNTVNGMRYSLLGRPDNSTYVALDGVNVRFFNGRLRNTETRAHVPVGTPNRGNQATRFWYLIFAAPPPVIGRTDNNSVGWTMYNGNGGCGLPQSRCWRYRRNGDERAVITYQFSSNSITLVKNF